MNFDSILNSNEYKCKLSEHLTSLLKRTKMADTEATISFAFESEIYFLVRTLFNFSPIVHKEQNQTSVRHKFTGRMDAVCNNLVIEYKVPNKLRKETDKIKAEKQLSNYLLQLLEKEKNEYHGVLTDGVKIKYMYFIEGSIHSTSYKKIDETDLDKLVHSLIDVSNKRFVPKNIVNDFKLNSSTNVTFDLARYLFNCLNTKFSGKTAMLYQEWEVLFHLSETDKGQNDDIKKRRKALGKLFGVKIEDNETDYKALFALQTTYAIIVKLIACKVVTKIEFNKNIEYFSDLSNIDSTQLRELIQLIEDGYVFQTGGVRNLLEGDFFSWYCNPDIWSDEESDIIIRIINILEGYSNTYYKHGYSTIDIFIDLYMEIMPAEVRHSLGEYFTPAWLADFVVTESIKLIETDNFTAIDPCCGSGVFVMAIIKHIIGNTDVISLSTKAKKELLNSILSRVKGVDINPLSVLTAKVSFYLSIRPLTDGDDIEIPIYLGDSANIPAKTIVDNLECYKYQITTKQENISIVLPSSFVENNDFLSIMSGLQARVKTGEVEVVYDEFAEIIPNLDSYSNLSNEIRALSEKLVMLHNKNWDGIWIRIVANFMLVGRIKNIDIIVGNPPWIKWEFLPQAYAEKIKSLCIDRHLFSGQTYMGAISLNICALIANVTASTWLSKDGVLAFLMPQTLLTQDSYAGFRNFYTDVSSNKRMFLQRLDDWTTAGNPFIDTSEKFMTFYYRKKNVDYFKHGIPIYGIKKKRGKSIIEINSKQSFREVSVFFESFISRAFQMDKKRTGYSIFKNENLQLKDKFDSIIGKCEYKARSGVEFTPAEVYFVEPVKKVNNKNSFLFKKSSFKNSKYKSLSAAPFQLETKFIKPVIKAPEILPFGFDNNNNYCIFPYKEKVSISVETKNLLKLSPKLFNYLNNNKNLINKQSKRSLTISRGTAFYSLSKVGKYTFAPYLVTFRDNTKLSAAVVRKIKTPWGEEVMPICAKHCPYISQDLTGRNISEEEAYYLCGILNTPIVQQYMKATFSTRSYSIDFNIKIPLYDKLNEDHLKIMKLAKKATLTKPTENIYADLEAAYINMCNQI